MQVQAPEQALALELEPARVLVRVRVREQAWVRVSDLVKVSAW